MTLQEVPSLQATSPVPMSPSPSLDPSFKTQLRPYHHHHPAKAAWLQHPGLLTCIMEFPAMGRAC